MAHEPQKGPKQYYILKRQKPALPKTGAGEFWLPTCFNQNKADIIPFRMSANITVLWLFTLHNCEW